MSEERNLSAIEQRLNALLDGELDDQEIASLRVAANRDPEFAQTLEQTLALKSALGSIPKRKVPATLAQKLQAIPDSRTHRRSGWLAIAAAAMVLIAVGSWQLRTPADSTPNAQQLALARQDIDVTFGYLQRINRKASRRIESSVANGLNRPLSTITVGALNEHLGVMEE